MDKGVGFIQLISGVPTRMGGQNRECKLSVFTSGAHLSSIL
jgi:hypothetical protein